MTTKSIYWRTDSKTLTQHAVPDALTPDQLNQNAICGFKPRGFWYLFNPLYTPICKRCEEIIRNE